MPNARGSGEYGRITRGSKDETLRGAESTKVDYFFEGRHKFYLEEEESPQDMKHEQEFNFSSNT